MTDLPVPAFGRGRSYDESMGQIFRPEMSIDGKSRICGDFLNTEEYAMRREWVKQRLEFIRHEFPDLLFCIENDFPAYGSANLFAGDSAASFGHPICLDTCHLWAAAFIYYRDFHHEVLEFLNKCDVQMVHLHASQFTPETVKTEWGDGHLPLSVPNLLDLPRFVRSCRENGVKHFVLEIIQATPDDIHAFAGMWNS
jgi:sugar phosphate isomerase/epimerase